MRREALRMKFDHNYYVKLTIKIQNFHFLDDMIGIAKFQLRTVDRNGQKYLKFVKTTYDFVLKTVRLQLKDSGADEFGNLRSHSN